MGLKAVANPNAGPNPPISNANFSDNETPTGTINSTTGSDGNGAFTLTNAPSPAGSLQLEVTTLGSATGMVAGIHYNLSGSTITYTAGNFPTGGGGGSSTMTHRAWYRHA